MSTPVSTPASRRVLETAAQLFYERGVCATGVDLVAERSGVAKTTMYAHYGSKDGLVAAYLAERGRAWREHLASEVKSRSTDPRERLLAIFDVLAEWMDGEEFAGCPFIKVAGELGEGPHPAKDETQAHRRWVVDYFLELTRQLDVADPGDLATSLSMLYDAAMVHGALDGSAGAPARHARQSAGSLIDAAIG